MKTKVLATLLPALLLAAASLTSSAAPTITGTAEPGTVTKLPGSPGDFEFFDATSATMPATPTAVHTDFTVAVSSNNSGYGSSLISPLGDEVNTGVKYSFGTAFNPGETANGMSQFTLGSGSFDYSSFYVYVLYGNEGSSVFDTSSFILTPNDYASDSATSDSLSTIGGTQVDVTDSSDASNGTTGQIVEFHVTNSTPNEKYSILSTAPTFGEMGGISFSQTSAYAVPEPGTLAMMFAGLACLIGLQRFARKA